MHTHKVLGEESHLQDRRTDFQKSQNNSSADAFETIVHDFEFRREKCISVV